MYAHDYVSVLIENFAFFSRYLDASGSFCKEMWLNLCSIGAEYEIILHVQYRQLWYEPGLVYT